MVLNKAHRGYRAFNKFLKSSCGTSVITMGDFEVVERSSTFDGLGVSKLNISTKVGDSSKNIYEGTLNNRLST